MTRRMPYRADLLLIALLWCLGAARTRAATDAPGGDASGWLHCPHCDLMLGAGATFRPWDWTDGTVLPALLEIDRSRYEVGAFRFATRQYLGLSYLPPSTVSARPYWGFSVMRRWQILHRSRFKLYLGLGIAYRSRTDLLEGSKWNFAYLLALRFSPARRVFLELGVRHWSDAWTRLPNRGENMTLLTVGFR